MTPVLAPLWHLVSRYPLVFVPFVALLALVWGGIPDGFDAVHVLWADAAGTAIASGLAVGIYFAAVIILVRALDDVRDDHDDETSAPPSYLGAWIVMCVLAMLPAVARSDLFQTTVTLSDESVKPIDQKYVLFGVHQTRFYFPLGVAIALGVGCVGILRANKSKEREDTGFNTRERWFGWATLWAVAFGYIVMCLAHWADPELFLSWVPAGVTAILLIGLLTAAAAGLHRLGSSTWGKRLFYPVVLGVIVGTVLFGGYFDPVHRVRGLDEYYANAEMQPKLANYEAYRKLPSTLVKDTDALAAWQERMSAGKTKPTGPLIIVSVSGGASTSAVFVARALFRLELRFPGLVNRMRIISGASGGMLGAAYFVSQMRPGSPYREEARETDANEADRKAFLAYRERLQSGNPLPDDHPEQVPYQELSNRLEVAYIAGMQEDFLSPLFQKWVHKDLNPAVWLFDKHTTNDRGAALEYAWDRTLKGRPGVVSRGEKAGWQPDLPALGVPFSDLRDEERAAKIPSLVFTPMMVEDGRQMIISNLDLDYMSDYGSYCDPYKPDTGTKQLAYSAAEFYRLFPKAAGTFQLSTAVRLNASFPFLSPAAELPTVPPRRVVDAGYYDNYGLVVPARWLETNRDVLEEFETPVWLLQLWTYGYDELSRSFTTGAEGNGKSGLRSSTAPFSGLYAAWRANMAYRGEERLNNFMYGWNVERSEAGLSPLAFRFRKDIGKENLPMNWVLNKCYLARIDGEADTSKELLNATSKVVARSGEKEVVPADAVLAELQKGDKPPPPNPAALKQQAEFAAELYKIQVPPVKGAGAKPGNAVPRK